MSAQGLADAEIQRINNNKALGDNAFQISTHFLKGPEQNRVTTALDNELQIRGTPQATSVGPTFGQSVANDAIKAILLSLLYISIYIGLRFEWKYAVPVLIALMHDLLITAGVYALLGREVTTSTVAALLTILGYSLYDTVIVFDRVRENVPRMPRAAFSQIVNRSMSEVITRSLATTFCTALPILALLLFGGDTLKDFAFALLVGVASGAYSSIFIASPVLTHWKEREPVYRRRRARIVRELGFVPPYAKTATGEIEDVEPEQKRKRGRSGRLTAPEEPGQQIARDEFQELVRDLGVDGEASPAASRAGIAQQAPAEELEPEPSAPERDPAADLTPEDLVLKDDAKPREKR